MVVIKWYGHACFAIIPSKGPTIVIDPHDGKSLGLKPPQILADIVLITHEHFDHNAYNIVAKPSARVFSMNVEEINVDDIKIIGVETYHDKDKGKRRGRNVMYKIVVDGVSILHLGDLGHILDEKHAALVQPIDIVIIPVGGVFTIDGKEAWKVIEILKPSVVVPMHYWIQGLELPLKPLDEFLSHASSEWSIVKVDSNYVSIDKSDIKQKTICILKYTP